MPESKLDKATWLLKRSALDRHATSWPTLGVLLCDVLLVVASVALLQLYVIHHECVHRAVFVDDRYNRWLGHVLGFILVYPFLQRRRSHMLHHAWAGHLSRDPTNARAAARLSTLPPRVLSLLNLLWRCWVPFLALNERLGLWLAPFRDDVDHRSRKIERVAAFAHLAGYTLATSLLIWSEELELAARLYAPALVTLLVAEELINLPHHLQAPIVSSRLPLWRQDEVTDSCASLPVWSNVVLLHFNLHTAHHLFPALPWHTLPVAQKALAGESASGSRCHEFAWSWRQRRARFERVFASYLRGARTTS
jgi:omega-6 fatty acid desaturase (delta-12 desaturase)